MSLIGVRPDNHYVFEKGVGIVNLAEFCEKSRWVFDKSLRRDQVASFVDGRGRPCFREVAAYGDKQIPIGKAQLRQHAVTYKVSTLLGLSLEGSTDFRVLHLSESGVARWSQLSHLRPGDLLIVNTGCLAFEQETQSSEEKRAEYKFMGALAGHEFRSESLFIPTTNPTQRQAVRNWAKLAGFSNPFEQVGPSYTSFTGLARLKLDLVEDAKKAVSSKFLAKVRKSNQWLQKDWLTGLILTHGRWSGSEIQHDLELELVFDEVAETAQLIAQNLGIQLGRFQTLNTFGDCRTKLFLHSKRDQALANTLLFEDQIVPLSWKDRSVGEDSTESEILSKTLQQARRLATSFGIVLPELSVSRESLSDMASRIAKFCRTNRHAQLLLTLRIFADSNVGLDRVVGVEKNPEKVDVFSLIGPIGDCYTLNGFLVPAYGC